MIRQENNLLLKEQRVDQLKSVLQSVSYACCVRCVGFNWNILCSWLMNNEGILKQ
jgi:hypothetical protein